MEKKNFFAFFSESEMVIPEKIHTPPVVDIADIQER